MRLKFSLHSEKGEFSQATRLNAKVVSIRLFLCPVEIRDFGGPNEAVLTYPHPSIRLRNGGDVLLLHRNPLGSVRAVTTAA